MPQLVTPVINSSLSIRATVGIPFSYQITATGLPTSFGATPLPAGLNLNAATGLISGTPHAVGTPSITISATNTTGTGSAVLALTITAGDTLYPDRTPPLIKTEPFTSLLEWEFAKLRTFLSVTDPDILPDEVFFYGQNKTFEGDQNPYESNKPISNLAAVPRGTNSRREKTETLLPDHTSIPTFVGGTQVMWNHGGIFQMINVDFVYEIPSGGSLMMENGHYLLLEDGSYLLLG